MTGSATEEVAGQAVVVLIGEVRAGHLVAILHAAMFPQEGAEWVPEYSLPLTRVRTVDGTELDDIELVVTGDVPTHGDGRSTMTARVDTCGSSTTEHTGLRPGMIVTGVISFGDYTIEATFRAAATEA